MDKIPFLPPDDPVNQATVDYLKANNEDWFNGHVLPQATIRLKQGFGRLIRSKDDCGLVVILDPRLHTKGYGRKIIKSLPEVRQMKTLSELEKSLKRLWGDKTCQDSSERLENALL